VRSRPARKTTAIARIPSHIDLVVVGEDRPRNRVATFVPFPCLRRTECGDSKAPGPPRGQPRTPTWSTPLTRPSGQRPTVYGLLVLTAMQKRAVGQDTASKP